MFKLYLAFVAILAVAGSSPSLHAQNVTQYTPEQALSLLDQQIRMVFGYPKDGGALKTDPAQWLSLTYVGLEVPPPKDEESKKLMQQAINLLAVSCPPADQGLGSFANSHRLDQVYEVILTQTALRRPDVKIEGIKEATQATIGPDGKPTAKYLAFKDFEKRFAALSKEIRKAGSDEEKLELGQEQDSLLEEWSLLGHREEIGKHIDKIVASGAISDASGIAWRLRMLAGYRRLMNAQFGALPFSPVRPKSNLVPGVESWASDAGWSKLKLVKNQQWASDVAKYEAKSRSYKVSGGGWLWKASANVTKKSTTKSEKRIKEVSNLSIEFDVRRAVIDRPWFDQRLLFEPGFWTWLKPDSMPANAPLPLVSKGLGDDGLPKENDDATYSTYRIPIPVVPSEVIVARNLTLSATVSKDDFALLETMSKTEWSGGGSARFGFWKLGGSASGSDYSTLKDVKENESSVDFTLTAKGPVVIGFISNVVPELPSPRLQSLWPKNAWFPPNTSGSYDPDKPEPDTPKAALPEKTLENEENEEFDKID